MPLFGEFSRAPQLHYYSVEVNHLIETVNRNSLVGTVNSANLLCVKYDGQESVGILSQPFKVFTVCTAYS